MKAILEYTLPDEKEEFELASKATYYLITLSDLNNFLRSKLKYENLTEEQYNIYDEVRSKLFELASENNIEI